MGYGARTPFGKSFTVSVALRHVAHRNVCAKTTLIISRSSGDFTTTPDHARGGDGLQWRTGLMPSLGVSAVPIMKIPHCPPLPPMGMGGSLDRRVVSWEK